MKDWKNTLSSICGLIIVICGAIATLGASGGIVIPTWITSVCGALAAISAGLIGWITGKNPNLTSKTPDQVNTLNNAK